MATLHINSKAIEGKPFTIAGDPNEYTCVGFAANDTFLIVGTTFDSVNNRSVVGTFKFKDVKFKGELTVPPA